jgi:hypothetical protein
MGLPTYEDNLIGYENGSLLDKVDKIKGKRFQVNHGVADDNVSKQPILVLKYSLSSFPKQSFTGTYYFLPSLKFATLLARFLAVPKRDRDKR